MGILPMNIEILPPSDDRVFKKLLISPEAEPTLIYFASAIIKRPVISVLVRSNELPVDDTNEKAERFDVNCKIDDNSQVDVEMQASRMKEEKDGNHSNLRARSIYNLCDLHSSQPSKGKSFYELIRTYQVMFCGYTVFAEREDFINSFSMRHDIDNGLLHDAVNVMFVELSKLNNVLKKPVEQMTDIEKISVFLRYADIPDYREVVNKVIASKEGLAVAGEILMTISKDERERAIMRSRRMYQADLESNMLTAEKVGHAKGRAEGHAEGRAEGLIEGRMEGRTELMFEIARNAIRKKMPIDSIIDITGLTSAEIESVRDTDQ